MGIERTDLEDKETKEKEAEEKESLEAERKLEIEARAKELEEAKIGRARAEGEAEALKRGISTQSAPAWTDEQWEMEAQKHGMSGSQLKASVLISKGVVDAGMKPLQEAAELARKEAQEAKEELRKIKEGKGTEKIKQEFLDKNPVLRLHKDQVEEFLSTYPDSDNVNGETLKKRLDLASKFVKGTVKENMRTSKPSESGSTRLEASDEDLPAGELGDFDPKGTGNAGGAQLMANVHANFGKGIRRSDSMDVWKKSLDDEGRGVSISMDEDLERYNALRDRDTVGGKRG